MASINFSKFLNKATPKPIPGTISSNQRTNNVPVYVDLHLDLLASQSIGNGLNTKNANDIVVDINEQAIKNSVFNLLCIRSGYKILMPWINTALEQYLFDPISNTRAQLIGQNIISVLETYEPRITVQSIDVIPYIDQQTYVLTLYYYINQISKATNLQITINNGQITIL